MRKLSIHVCSSFSVISEVMTWVNCGKDSFDGMCSRIGDCFLLENGNDEWPLLRMTSALEKNVHIWLEYLHCENRTAMFLYELQKLFKFLPVFLHCGCIYI